MIRVKRVLQHHYIFLKVLKKIRKSWSW